MKFNLTLFNPTSEIGNDGEPMSLHLRNVISELMSKSAERQLALSFDESNRQAVAEEIGYRNALADVASYFQEEI